MKNQTMFNAPEPKNVTLNYQVIDWRDKNGHLLARIIVGKDKVVFTVKCHRCKHVEEKDVQTLKI
jgi:hypothetical protein